MRRREFLAVPLAALVNAGSAEEPSFERIDTHNHIHRSAPSVVAAMEQTGWRGLSICDSREVGDQPSVLPQMIPGTAAFHKESKGRWAWATTFDARGFEDRDFAERVIAALDRDFRREAIAVKIWKNIGMGIRGKSGAYLLPDNPSLLPIYEAILKAGKTLICHLAEPNGAWLPLDDANTESGYLKAHPEWHMYGRPDAPPKDAILAARDRIVARLPGLRVIACHLGSNEEDLPRLAKRLDALSNMVVDVASRVRYLASGNREDVRRFILKYQDRILYGTDFGVGPNTAGDERAARSLQNTHERDWNFFATDQNGKGLALPEGVLRKIFRENAARSLPGILG